MCSLGLLQVVEFVEEGAGAFCLFGLRVLILKYSSAIFQSLPQAAVVVNGFDDVAGVGLGLLVSWPARKRERRYANLTFCGMHNVTIFVQRPRRRRMLTHSDRS